MTHIMVDDLITQYEHTFRILFEEMARFNSEQWRKGLSLFQTPVNQSVHIFDCLDFYFRKDSTQEYRWGHRFGGGWWEQTPDQLPDRPAVEAYARELEERIMGRLSALEDEDLAKTGIGNADENQTLLGHLIYAARHTLHHHGQLAALAVYHGLEGGSWD